MPHSFAGSFDDIHSFPFERLIAHVLGGDALTLHLAVPRQHCRAIGTPMEVFPFARRMASDLTPETAIAEASA